MMPYTTTFRAVLLSAALTASLLTSVGNALAEDEFFGSYTERRDTVTAGAGDAKEINAAAMIVNPWPRNVMNRNIPGNGARMAKSIVRYEDVTKLKEAAPPITATSSDSILSGSSSSSSSGH